jgi:curved DNA-binding protein CbpA
MVERPELSEEVDLDPETRRYVLDLYDRIHALTHYEVLGVPRTADKKTIKRTYFRLAGLLHPDRYFSKKLGSYKPKMEAVFARATEAFDVLSAADKRAKYDATLGAATTSPAPIDPRIAQKREAALAELKKRFAEREGIAKRHADAAKRAKAAGDLVSAIDAYEMALTYAPRDEALKAALAELQKATAEKLADTHAKQALLEERFGQWGDAVKSWEAVVLARPDDATARERLANARARAGVVKK